MPRSDFAIFILTHGRPDRQHTLKLLSDIGYDGQIYLVIDDEDDTADAYKEQFGDQVIQFSKADAAQYTDVGDNQGHHRGVVYARNAVHRIAGEMGLTYYLAFDDDYKSLFLRSNSEGVYGSYRIRTNAVFSGVIDAMLEFLEVSGFSTVAMSQGGDHIGGFKGKNPLKLYRKAMNGFFVHTGRPLSFMGRINEDATAYAWLQRMGVRFATIMPLQVNQLMTQTNPGGLTEIYLDTGTYVKSFYSVMYCPSAVKVSGMGDPRGDGPNNYRLHHSIKFRHCAPLILSEKTKK